MNLPCAAEAARLFDYPGLDFPNHVTAFRNACEAYLPTLEGELEQLSSDFGTRNLTQAQELYTRTFDLNPTCAPYLSVHLFGEGNMKRARLMTGLAELYAARGVVTRGELPDHLAVVLGALDRLDASECAELVERCFPLTLKKMRLELEQHCNPYALAIVILERVATEWRSRTEAPCG